MTHRYFVPELPRDGGLVQLPDGEASHANRVMRVKPGDEITLFDGRNHECLAVVESQSKKDCLCTMVGTPVVVDRDPEVNVTLATSLPKGDRAKSLLERITELGVKTVVPLHAARSQGNPSDKSIEKLNRVAIEACKQSGRNQVPLIEPTRRAMDWFATPTDATCIIAHPIVPASSDGTSDLKNASMLDSQGRSKVVIAVGPEGGFTDEELDRAMGNGFRPISLGPRIYRIETAAIAMVTMAIHTMMKD